MANGVAMCVAAVVKSNRLLQPLRTSISRAVSLWKRNAAKGGRAAAQRSRALKRQSPAFDWRQFLMSASLIGWSGSSAFQTIHHSSVDVAHGLVLLCGLGTKALPSWDFEDEAEQSFGRPCRQINGRFKRTYELTSSIVPRGTSFHRWVELECSPIAFDS